MNVSNAQTFCITLDKAMTEEVGYGMNGRIIGPHSSTNNQFRTYLTVSTHSSTHNISNYFVNFMLYGSECKLVNLNIYTKTTKKLCPRFHSQQNMQQSIYSLQVYALIKATYSVPPSLIFQYRQ